jgi:hypothetical protein
MGVGVGGSMMGRSHAFPPLLGRNAPGQQRHPTQRPFPRLSSRISGNISLCGPIGSCTATISAGVCVAKRQCPRSRSGTPSLSGQHGPPLKAVSRPGKRPGRALAPQLPRGLRCGPWSDHEPTFGTLTRMVCFRRELFVTLCERSPTPPWERVVTWMRLPYPARPLEELPHHPRPLVRHLRESQRSLRAQVARLLLPVGGEIGPLHEAVDSVRVPNHLVAGAPHPLLFSFPRIAMQVSGRRDAEKQAAAVLRQAPRLRNRDAVTEGVDWRERGGG